MERKRPKPGEIYTHFKGRRYLILDIAIHTETEEELVIYKAMYGTHKVYARPLNMFLSPVDKEKYPNEEQRYRFELTGRVKKDVGTQACEAPELDGEREEEGHSDDLNQMPLIFQFLDCRTNEDKLRYLYQHRSEVTDSFLLTAGESIGCTITEKTTELRFEELMSYLRVKIKYETGRLR